MSFLKKGILVSGGEVLNGVLNLMGSVLFARSLGTDGTGQIEVFRSANTMFMMFLGLGIGNAIIYFLNNEKIEPVRIVTNSLKFTLWLSLLLIISFVWAIHAFQGYFGHISYLTAIWFSIGTACGLGTNTLDSVFVSELAVRPMILVYIAPRIIILASIVLFLAMGDLNVESALAIISFSYIGSYMILLYLLREFISLKIPFEWKLVYSIVKYGMTFLSISVIGILEANIPVISLRYLNQADFSAVGLYSRAIGVCGLVSMIPGAIGPMYYSKWAEVKGATRAQQVEMALRFSLAFGVISCIFLLLIGKFLIRLLYGEAFIEAFSALEILAPSYIFMTIFNVFFNLFNGDGKAVINVYMSLVILGIVAGVSWLTVKRLGIEGPAYSMLISYATVCLACAYISIKYFGLRLGNFIFLKKDDFIYIKRGLIPPSMNARYFKIIRIFQ
jgi:O-antigen/teichoic acid export membrane protein